MILPELQTSPRNVLYVRKLTTVAELEDLAPEWLALWRGSAASPFQSPGWLIPWARNFTGTNLVVVTFWEEGELVGIAPFYSWREEGREMLFLLGHGISDYLDICVSPRHARVVSQALQDWLRSPDAPNLSIFDQVPEGSLIRRLALARREQPGTSCPVLDLTGKMAANYAPAKQLEKVRYYRRRAARHGSFEFERATPETSATLMKELFRMHALRWSSHGEEGVLSDPQIQTFHLQVAAKLAASGDLRLYALRCQERMAGVLYALVGHRTTCFYLSGFDPAFSEISPGMLLIGHAIEAALEEGHIAFDFLRGSEPYKYAWGARDRPTFFCTFGRA